MRTAKNHGFTRLGAVLRNWPSRHSIANELQAEMIICNFLRIPEKDTLHMENCRVALYEVDNLTLAHTLLERGADLIETFTIGKLLGTHD